MKTRALILAVVMVFTIGIATAQTSETPAQNPDQSTSAQTPNTSTSTTTTQSTTQTNPDANANQNADPNAEQLPQTASLLPLLGLLGVGSLAAGVLSRRKK